MISISTAIALLAISQVPPDDRTAKLHEAIKHRDAKTVRSLLGTRMFPYYQIDGVDALMLSMRTQDSEVIRAFIEAQPKDSQPRAIIIATSYCIHEDLSKSLRTVSEMKGWKEVRVYDLPPLSAAIVLGKPKCTAYLAQTQNNFELDKRKNSPLHYAAARGLAYVRKLAITPSSVNLKNRLGQTPLHFAAVQSPESNGYLLSRGANPNIKDWYGHTPAQRAEEDRRQEASIRSPIHILRSCPDWVTAPKFAVRGVGKRIIDHLFFVMYLDRSEARKLLSQFLDETEIDPFRHLQAQAVAMIFNRMYFAVPDKAFAPNCFNQVLGDKTRALWPLKEVDYKLQFEGYFEGIASHPYRFLEEFDAFSKRFTLRYQGALALRQSRFN